MAYCWKGCDHLFKICTSCDPPTCFAPMRDTFINLDKTSCVTLFERPVIIYICYVLLVSLPPTSPLQRSFFQISQSPCMLHIVVKTCDHFLMSCTSHSPPPFCLPMGNLINLAETPHETYCWQGLWAFIILCNFYASPPIFTPKFFSAPLYFALHGEDIWLERHKTTYFMHLLHPSPLLHPRGGHFMKFRFIPFWWHMVRKACDH